MLAAAGKNRIVTLDIRGNLGYARRWRVSWSAGSKMAATSAADRRPGGAFSGV
nr:Uncharacterised protein [Raoultella sp. NCTC 9187]